MSIPPARRLDFSEVPVIDLAPVIEGDARRLPETIEVIDRACSDVGFMYVKNHGVPRSLRERAQQEAARFFSRPVAEKMTVALADSPLFRGYIPLHFHGAGTKGGNHSEVFIISHEMPDGSGEPLVGPNQWPADGAEFKEALNAYFRAGEALAYKMMPCFSKALGLGENVISDMFEAPRMMMNINHYIPQPNPSDADQIGLRPHTDAGAFTILWQDSTGGLEILNKSGDWVEVPPLEDTYVINIGDTMQILSNGRFSSTPHRVINRYTTDRYSMPIFVNPSYDSVVKPLVGECPADFEPFTSGDYLLKRLHVVYPQRDIRKGQQRIGEHEPELIAKWKRA